MCLAVVNWIVFLRGVDWYIYVGTVVMIVVEKAQLISNPKCHYNDLVEMCLFIVEMNSNQEYLCTMIEDPFMYSKIYINKYI